MLGLRPKPAILGVTLTHHLDAYKEQHPEVTEQIQDSLYVDNVLSGADNAQKGFKLCEQSKELMAKGTFNLWK